MKHLVYTSIAAFALTISMPAQGKNESPIIHNVLGDISSTNIQDMLITDQADQFKRGGFRGSRGFRGRGFRGRGFRRGGFIGRGFRGSYIRPFIGFRLPTYWINRSFFIPNYSFYNLSAPTNGHVWSRYYNDAVLRDQQGFVVQTVNNVPWQDGSNAFAQNAGPAMPVEGQVYGWSEGANVGGTPTTGQAGTYQGQWTGQYIDEQGRQFQGRWNGTYTDENGQIFEGQWDGTTIGAPVGQTATTNTNVQTVTNVQTAPVGTPFLAQQFPQQIPAQPVAQGFNGGQYEQCLRSNGITGSILGAIIGGVAGNRIAGRNARTAGALIGGGVGALGGLAVERALDKCKGFNSSSAQGQFQQGQFSNGQFSQGQFAEPSDGRYARCLRKRGITGGVLGALLGGVAGNRIAGRNARTVGTLIGAGVGGLSGAVIEKATRKCRKKRLNRRFNNGFATQYYQPQVAYYWVSPGYYYPQGTTTITVTPSTSTVTEEIIETKGKRLVKPSKRLRKPQR